MHSNKSRDPQPRAAVEPQRRHGKERVAKLLEVGATVIAEKGYEAATMAEIAERAGSPIGSLYRFFPNKEILANALIERYAGLVAEAFERIDLVAGPTTIDETADALAHFLMELRPETKAMSALLEVRSEWSVKRLEFRQAAVKCIARTLTLLAPALPKKAAESMGVVLLLNMKSLARLKSEDKFIHATEAIEELCEMNRLYVRHRLAALTKASKR